MYEVSLSKPKEHSRPSYKWVYLLAALISFLLLLRDTFGIGVNKYIFVAIALVAVMVFDMNKSLCLLFFMLPLYVGMPGNYITIIFLIKFLFQLRYIKFKMGMFISTFVACIFVFVQNIMQSFTTVAHMSTITGIIIVFLLFSYTEDVDKNEMIYMYVIGVAVMGLIMLVSTLQVYDFEELLTSFSRLGTSSLKFSSSAMAISVDPNYYGLFTISAISLGYKLLFNKLTKSHRIITLVSIISALTVALIGLSRAFVLVLIIWAMFAVFSLGKPHRVFMGILTFAIIAVLILLIFPEVTNAISERFYDKDMSDGNGRISLIQEFWDIWLSSFANILLGVGMYVCNVHCMPLQFVFGGGIVLTSLILIFFYYVINISKGNRKLRFSDYLPIILTFVMTCTVPIATSLTFMFPFIITIYSLKEGNYSYEITKKTHW